jgi:hypothetical protein
MFVNANALGSFNKAHSYRSQYTNTDLEALGTVLLKCMDRNLRNTNRSIQLSELSVSAQERWSESPLLKDFIRLLFQKDKSPCAKLENPVMI